MSKVPFRPTHTGSARAQAKHKAGHSIHAPKPPTHVRLPHAAVAVEREPTQDKPARMVRWAKRPLALTGTRSALALRQEAGGPVEVLVQNLTGARQWRKVEQVIGARALAGWVHTGF